MAHIRIKLDNAELDCDGPEEFLKTEVPKLWKLAVETYKELPAHKAATPAAPTNGNGNGHVNGNGSGGAIPGFQSTTENIGAKLGVNSGGELILAAAARLAFVQGKATFTRDELHDEIKTAKSYYNASHRKNLSKTLHKLVRDSKLNETTPGNYAFTPNVRGEIQAKLNG